jgi:thiamine-monophosphate kinase
MALSEIGIIERFFTGLGAGRTDVVRGVGDDGAVLDVGQGNELVVSTDTLVAGVHFPGDTPPAAIAVKALAVNLSDLAAMGAEPRWVLLALTLPSPDEPWLREFSGAFREMAAAHGVALVGGDLTSGPLTVTVQVMGTVPAGSALCRHTARPGDLVCVTGELGAAAFALRLLGQGGRASVPPHLLERLDRPVPRVAAGLALRGFASAAIDISDGLGLDLERLCRASGVGADIEIGRLPLCAECAGIAGFDDRISMALGGGDDYELLFTVPESRAQEIESRVPGRITRIGRIREGSGVRWHLAGGKSFEPRSSGYQHFGNAI